MKRNLTKLIAILAIAIFAWQDLALLRSSSILLRRSSFGGQAWERPRGDLRQTKGAAALTAVWAVRPLSPKPTTHSHPGVRDGLRPRARIERENSGLISPADYPPWLVQSMEKAQAYLIEIKKITRRITSTMRQARYEPTNQMDSLDKAIAQWERLRTVGASLDEFSKFEKMFNGGFGREIGAVFEEWYEAIKSGSLYDYSKRQKHKRTIEERIKEVGQAIDEMHELKVDFEKAYDKLVKYVNGLALYLAVKPYDPESEFQKMFRKEDIGKIEKRLRREGFDPARARALLVHPLAYRAEKILRKSFHGTITIDAKTLETMAQDLVRHFYPELGRRFFSVEDDRARVAQIRQEILHVSEAGKELLFAELVDVIDRGYMTGSDGASLVEVRHAAQDVLFVHFNEIDAYPAVLGLLKERVVGWMEKETQFTRWDSLLRLFGDVANRPENLAQLRKLYQINKDFSIALQIMAVYTQVMTNIRESARSGTELESALDQINAFSHLKHNPIISNYLDNFRQYVMTHLAHWDRMNDLQYLRKRLSGGPMTFTHAMLWSESAADAHAPNLWRAVTPPVSLRDTTEALPYPTDLHEKERKWLIDSNKRMASEKLRTYLTDLINKMERARGASPKPAPIQTMESESLGQSLSSVLRPKAAGEKPFLGEQLLRLREREQMLVQYGDRDWGQGRSPGGHPIKI